MADSAALSTSFVALLKANAVEVRLDLQDDLLAVKEYMALRLAHLATCVDQPGYREAMIAERDSIALKAAGRAIHTADASDARLIGLIEGALDIGARALAAA